MNDEERPDEQPEATEPEAVEPEAAQPETAEPDAAEQPEAADEPEPADEPVVPSAPQPPEAAAEQPEPPQAPAAAEVPEGAVVPSAPQPPSAPDEEPHAEEQLEEYEPTPRQRPEIPGADLIPDIAPEADEYLDAEARAAAEAEAEARAAREREERDQETPQPIADAAIDLAAGARYTATGKRKSAVARVILKPGDGSYAINGKGLEAYFPRETLRRVIRQPLELVGYESRMDVVARMHGGGVAAQADALRHGISRALIVADPHLRSELKRRGFLTRDPRVKERKKAGLKKARKRPQFSKR